MARFWQRRARGTTFFGRLARDIRGNTIAMMAAALIPMCAMIGSGVDMSRAYMAQNRLRQACDAGALAGRRLLTGTTVSQALRDETTKYFAFNFPQGFFQTQAYTLAITVPAQGTLSVSTSTQLPTTIMKMFGFNTLEITAACSATQDFVATDVVLVVDMSGSMNCVPSASANCNNGNVEAVGSKMAALRSAAESLYDTLKPAQDQLRANNLRLRYGFVPYNATVNVGRLVYAKNPSYIRTGNYAYNTRTNVGRTDTTITNRAGCNERGGTLGPTFLGFGVCTFTSYPDNLWVYGRQNVDISQYVTGAEVRNPASSSPTERVTWSGCIEERRTNNTTITGGTGTTAPNDALDLDVNTMPGSTANPDDSRWAPWWPEVTYANNATSPLTDQANCASQASRLREYYNDKASFTSYLASLRPQGSTYHDIGMIWGAHFISPNGIFKSNTPETNNQNDPDNPRKLRGFEVRKYIIFMTDGNMAPSLDGYSAYGVEQWDKRVLGTATGSDAQYNRHVQRFRMACNEAKSQNAEVWVIAFATTLTDDMKKCATDESKAAGLSTTPQLIAKFQEIGNKIGSLRLSQ